MKILTFLVIALLVITSSINAQKTNTYLDMGISKLSNESVYEQMWNFSLSHDYNLTEQIAIGATGGFQNYSIIDEKGSFWAIPLTLGCKYKTTSRMFNPLVSFDAGYVWAMKEEDKSANGLTLTPGIGTKIMGVGNKSIDVIVQYYNQFKEMEIDNKLISGIGIKLRMQL